MLADVHEYLDFVKGRPPVDDLYDRLSRLLEDFGFQFHAYTVVRSPKTLEMTEFVTNYQEGATARTNYPDDWIERYDHKNYYFVDPLLRTAWREYSPFRWDRLDVAEKLSKQQQAMFADARAVGMRKGMTIPLHGPADGLFALTIGGDMSDEDFDYCWSNHRMDLFTVAAFSHETIMHQATRPNDVSSVNLSNREVQCLTWTSQGKTTWEISRILKISEDTTRYYLREATRKLGVHSKHHAVVKAIGIGLISA